MVVEAREGARREDAVTEGERIAVVVEDEEGAEITAYPVSAVERGEEQTEAKAGDEEKKPGSVVSLDAFRKKH